MPESCRRWSKSRWVLLILFSLLLAYCVFPGKREQRSSEGYIGDIYFSFPKDKYTFAVGTREENGRQVIYDNLWGFHLPDMTPFRRIFSADFISMDGPWVTANIRSAPATCPDAPIKAYLDKTRSGLRIFWLGDLPESLRTPEMLSMIKSKTPIYGLNKMSTPDTAEYKTGMIPAQSPWQKPRYYGPTEKYWSDDYCIVISCKENPYTQNSQCEHTYHLENNLVITMTYKHSHIGMWHEIQQEATKALNSFRRTENDHTK